MDKVTDIQTNPIKPMANKAKIGRIGKPNKKNPVEIGWCELVTLPEFDIHSIHAKIDTGANTSSLHAVDIKPFIKDDAAWVSFRVPKSPAMPAFQCEAPILKQTTIKSSNGHEQLRYVIAVKIILAGLQWDGQMTLANRGSMAFPILIGRRSLRRGFIVNSAKKWVFGRT